MSLSVQLWTMAAMLLSGIGMGVVFDGYRVVSDELRISRWWIPVFDLLYWIAATIVVFQVLSASNEGEVRIYVFLGLLLGIGSYYWLLSKWVVILVRGLIRMIRALIQFAIRTFIILIIRPLQLLFRLGKLLFAFALAFTIFLFKIVVQLVRPIWLLLRWMTSPLTRPIAQWFAGWGLPLLKKLRIHERYQAVKANVSGFWKSWKDRKKSD